MEIFTDVAKEHDIDGIEFCFRRWRHMILKVLDNHGNLTRMVRETRKMLDEVAREKARKWLLLSALVAPTIARPWLGTETWDSTHDRLIVSYVNYGASGGGYGNTVQLGDGSLITVYSYRGKDKATHVEAVRWRLPEGNKVRKSTH